MYCATLSLFYSLAGLLDGKRATSHWTVTQYLSRISTDITVAEDVIFIRDGNAYTSAGVTTGMDLALALVEADYGRDLAMSIARMLVIYYRREGGQSQYSDLLKSQSLESHTFRDLCTYIHQHPRDNLSIGSLAQRAVMSERNFSRSFTCEVGVSPGKFVEQARFKAAKALLEDTVIGLESIADKSGFASAEVLRRVFKKIQGVAPANYRRRFGQRLQA